MAPRAVWERLPFFCFCLYYYVLELAGQACAGFVLVCLWRMLDFLADCMEGCRDAILACRNAVGDMFDKLFGEDAEWEDAE